MIAIVLFAPLFAAMALMLVARFGRRPDAPGSRDEGAEARPRISPAYLRALAVDLLHRRGFEIEPDAVHGSPEDASQRLLAVKKGPWGESRYIVFIEAAPPGDLVDAPTVLELAEQVKTEPGAIGLMVTPYAVDGSALAGTEARIEVLDGRRLRDLVPAQDRALFDRRPNGVTPGAAAPAHG